MNSLQRQADQARRYREYREEIKELDISLSLSEFIEKDKKLTEMRGYLEGKKDTEEAQSAELAGIEAELEELRRKQLEADKILHLVQEESYRIDVEIQRGEERLKFLERELQNLKTLEAQYSEEIKRFSQEFKDAGQKKGAYDKELTTVESQSRETRKLLGAEEGKLKGFEEEYTKQ